MTVISSHPLPSYASFFKSAARPSAESPPLVIYFLIRFFFFLSSFAIIGSNLPEELQGYHTLVPLEAHEGTERRKLGNWFSVVYRAIRSSDGMPYALRRVESVPYFHYIRNIADDL